MGKRFAGNAEKVDQDKQYTTQEAFALIDAFAPTKFDETVDVSMHLGVDPRKSDQMVRGSVRLPHGLGKAVRVIVIAKGEKASEAEAAGAAHVGSDDLIEKISKGWLDFDKVVATPDMMRSVSQVAKVLGPRGLMPNPKLGTVTTDVARVVKELKAGVAEFRVDKGSNIHAPIGKKSFGKDKLRENFDVVLEAILKAKPSAMKGKYVKSLTISTTMGPGVRLQVGDLH